jgi:viroplasmin and RNaseH domain-containing protein
MPKWYVLYKGRVPGVYDEWDNCLKQMNKFKGNNYKWYNSREEVEDGWMNHLREKRKTNRIAVIAVFLTVIAVLLYLIIV